MVYDFIHYRPERICSHFADNDCDADSYHQHADDHVYPYRNFRGIDDSNSYSHLPGSNTSVKERCSTYEARGMRQINTSHLLIGLCWFSDISSLSCLSITPSTTTVKTTSTQSASTPVCVLDFHGAFLLFSFST